MGLIKKSGINFILAMVILAICHAAAAENVNWQNDYAAAA